MLKMTRVMNSKLLKEKVTIVTGASGVHGFEISKELLLKEKYRTMFAQVWRVHKSLTP
jgi:NAD(P)-dependent dehydrogenase (short-subunit alcohol dehydrogenase family)